MATLATTGGWRFVGSILATAIAGISTAACGAHQQPERPYPLTALVEAGGQRPIPPNRLDERLRQVYPPEAVAQHESGTAEFRIHITPDGTTSAHQLVSASAPPFAHACLSFLRDTHWTPARDARGNAVEVEVGFRCDFVPD
jgi:outer membrane biosynthesis protein TonB